MYKHIARHCQRQICCAYCARSHDTGDCPTPRDKDYAKCTNCAAENVRIKDPAKKLNDKHFAYARECPIRASCLAEAHQRRTYGLQYHPDVARPGNSSPGIVSQNDPIPAEATAAAAAATEWSPRIESRTDPSTRQRSAPSRSKSTAARKRAAANQQAQAGLTPELKRRPCIRRSTRTRRSW